MIEKLLESLIQAGPMGAVAALAIFYLGRKLETVGAKLDSLGDEIRALGQELLRHDIESRARRER